tara:strand:- start:17888 stop:18196 length:309 start_codon:yes stop_codon:yes gene_type:complete
VLLFIPNVISRFLGFSTVIRICSTLPKGIQILPAVKLVVLLLIEERSKVSYKYKSKKSATFFKIVVSNISLLFLVNINLCKNLAWLDLNQQRLPYQDNTPPN